MWFFDSQGLMVKTLFIIFLLPHILSAAVPEDQKLDRVTALPGQPTVGFSQYSGYITTDVQQGRALFYWLTEASSDPHSKPLVLWLNGGPGCSSVAYGASEEIGPFKIHANGSSLYLNEYSWNRVANLLFLESPAGVGFSYTNTTSNLHDSGDKRTAQDTLIFLVKWLERFPQYKDRDLYLSGESYAGHYVPQLANRIYDYNKKFSKPRINLKGFIIGNAVIDNYYDNIGTVAYWWSHSMISDTTYKKILKLCNFTTPHTSSKCDDALTYAMNHEFGSIDQYSIYSPACRKRKDATRFKNTLLRYKGYDPCSEHHAEKYYNIPEVQRALHANTTGIPYKWTACSDKLIRNWMDTETSMFPTYKKLIAAGLRIWIYSGDTDSVVPVTATRISLSHLHLKTKTHWYPWYSDGQVAGWTEVHEGVTFATVRGAGHEVPLFQPRRAFDLFQTFLSGKDLPKS